MLLGGLYRHSGMLYCISVAIYFTGSNVVQSLPLKEELLSMLRLPAWLILIKGHQPMRGEGLIVVIVPVFLHPGALLWSVCNCLWKNRSGVLFALIFLFC